MNESASLEDPGRKKNTHKYSFNAFVNFVAFVVEKTVYTTMKSKKGTKKKIKNFCKTCAIMVNQAVYLN